MVWMQRREVRDRESASKDSFFFDFLVSGTMSVISCADQGSERARAGLRKVVGRSSGVAQMPKNRSLRTHSYR